MHKFHSFMMKFLLVFTVISSSRLRINFVDGDIINATIEIHNPRTAFKQCSNGQKEWRICRGNFLPELYCPTVLEFNASHVEELEPCFTCQDAEPDCEKFVRNFLEMHNVSEQATYSNYWGYNIVNEILSSCRELCEAGKKGDACSSGYFYKEFYRGDSCTPGSHFCDFASDEEFSMDISGTCKACPLDPNECYQESFVTSIEGKRNCARCTLNCYEVGTSILTVNGDEVPHQPIFQAIQLSYQNASGPLIDCSNLLLESEDFCPGADGNVCIVDYGILGKSEVGKVQWQLSNLAERNGCVAIAIILSIEGFLVHNFDKLTIPFVIVSKEDGKQLLKSEHNSVAHAQVQLFGSLCFPPYPTCDRELPCSEREYCFENFVVVGGKYTEGYCKSCPMFENGDPDPAGCFFDRRDYGDNTLSMISPEVVTNCAKACDAVLVSDDCKFCPSEVSAFNFGVDDKDDQCFFCPNNDVKYPNKFFPLFGKNITCRMVQTFFQRLQVHKDSANCRLAQSMNFMCGCQGPGYAGANTHTKQVVLVWLPRVSAILSIAGSLFIIYDTMRTSQKRVKLRNQLLSTLSLFDIMGSCAYALTTLPTPSSDELYGAKGNMQTCIAQGFFIQIGTIACFLNVSLAFYYLLTIKYSWTEERLKRKHAACFLFVPPISVGLVYAFVGVQHYENVRVWCNNAAKWWPEIPVILAIISATGMIGTSCHHFYKIHNQTAQYTSHGSRLSMEVFKQSCWFVAAFYITWVPYVTLQFMFASGKAYNNYGLILSAATLVPLQGFWNSFVYIRPRYFRIEAHIFSSLYHVSTFFQRRLKADANEQSLLNSSQQTGPRAQVQVVQVYDTEGVSFQDEECNNTNISNKQDIDGKLFASTYRDPLDPKQQNVDQGALTGVSALPENGAVDTKESLAIKEPSRESTKIEFDQEVTCSVNGKQNQS